MCRVGFWVEGVRVNVCEVVEFGGGVFFCSFWLRVFGGFFDL